MHPVHSPRGASVVSERAKNFTGQIELVDLSYAPNVNHLSRSGCDAERSAGLWCYQHVGRNGRKWHGYRVHRAAERVGYGAGNARADYSGADAGCAAVDSGRKLISPFVLRPWRKSTAFWACEAAEKIARLSFLSTVNHVAI